MQQTQNSVLCSLEEAVRDVDQEIKREQRATHDIVRAMPAEKQEQYFSVMAASEQLLQVGAELGHASRPQQAVSCGACWPQGCVPTGLTFSSPFLSSQELAVLQEELDILNKKRQDCESVRNGA